MYMDPQKLSQLDPKLREAYQRVMGTSMSDSAPAGGPTPPPPMPDPNSIPQSQPLPTTEPIPTPPPPTIENPTTQPTQPSEAPMSEPQSQPLTPQPEAIPTLQSVPQQPPIQPANFDQMNSEVAAPLPSANFTAPAPQTQTNSLKKKNSMIPILIGIAGIIFIAVYTLFWTKIFNFKVPFLP